MEWIFIGLLLVAIAVIAVVLSGHKNAAETKYQEILSQLTATKEERVAYEKRMRERFGAIMSLDDEKAKVTNEIENLNKGKATIAAQLKTLNEAVRARQAENQLLEESDELHSMGFYQPHYDFGSSQAYAVQLDAIRAKQKLMLKNKEAAVCGIEWTVNGQ